MYILYFSIYLKLQGRFSENLRKAQTIRKKTDFFIFKFPRKSTLKKFKSICMYQRLFIKITLS